MIFLGTIAFVIVVLWYFKVSGTIGVPGNFGSHYDEDFFNDDRSLKK